ncbi:SUF system NifU family Fe-S cluster assembly protein [Puniceicoccaceae bacterium K14]|nr:SUF system NifU family Fe-S cluster assembly protein [Puniceicoccaceae bacterium K14]
MDPKDLYKQTLLKHSKSPHNEGELIDSTHQAKLTNSLCGDEVTVYLKIESNSIQRATFTAQCCSICTASASMLTQKVQGLPTEEAHYFAQKITTQLQDKDKPLVLSADDELQSLEGVKQFKSRIRCATLPWEAMLASLASSSE